MEAEPHRGCRERGSGARGGDGDGVMERRQAGDGVLRGLGGGAGSGWRRRGDEAGRALDLDPDQGGSGRRRAGGVASGWRRCAPAEAPGEGGATASGAGRAPDPDGEEKGIGERVGEA